MSDKKDYENVSNQVIDMLVGTTLKKHGVKLGEKKISEEEKKELRSLVENLKESVNQITKSINEKDKQE